MSDPLILFKIIITEFLVLLFIVSVFPIYLLLQENWYNREGIFLRDPFQRGRRGPSKLNRKVRSQPGFWHKVRATVIDVKKESYGAHSLYFPVFAYRHYGEEHVAVSKIGYDTEYYKGMTIMLLMPDSDPTEFYILEKFKQFNMSWRTGLTISAVILLFYIIIRVMLVMH